jgi:hypothetical protein
MARGSQEPPHRSASDSTPMLSGGRDLGSKGTIPRCTRGQPRPERPDPACPADIEARLGRRRHRDQFKCAASRLLCARRESSARSMPAQSPIRVSNFHKQSATPSRFRQVAHCSNFIDYARGITASRRAALRVARWHRHGTATLCSDSTCTMPVHGMVSADSQVQSWSPLPLISFATDPTSSAQRHSLKHGARPSSRPTC